MKQKKPQFRKNYNLVFVLVVLFIAIALGWQFFRVKKLSRDNNVYSNQIASNLSTLPVVKSAPSFLQLRFDVKPKSLYVTVPLTNHQGEKEFELDRKTFIAKVMGGGDGPCDMTSFGKTCNYTDEILPQGTQIKVWKDSINGVISVNTNDLENNGFYTDVISIRKKDFTGFDKQLQMIKNALNTAVLSDDCSVLYEGCN